MRKLTASFLVIAFAFALATVVAQPAEASTSTIYRNGRWSRNTIKRTKHVKRVKKQRNFALQGNLVGVRNTTGGNNANGNVGAGTTVATGKAETTTLVGNGANLNWLENQNCGCDQATPAEEKAVISTNGAGSTNTIVVKKSRKNIVKQSNTALQFNGVLVGSSTGENTASGNAGGTTSVRTGSSTVSTTAVNLANVNVIK